MALPAKLSRYVQRRNGTKLTGSVARAKARRLGSALNGLGAHLDTTEEPRYFGLKKTDKRWVHELELIRDVKADDSLALEMLSEFLGELVPMCRLHHKYDVGPLYEFCRNWDLCIVLGSGGCGFGVWIGGEDLFGRGASEPILAAYEEQSRHVGRLTRPN